MAIPVFEWTPTEKQAKEWLKARGARDVLRPDWICHHPTKDFWFLVEVKEQERFKPSRHDGSLQSLGSAGGHGISIFQFERRENLRKATGVRTLLVIKETDTGKWLCNYLDVLARRYFKTGKSKKIIFPVDSLC